MYLSPVFQENQFTDNVEFLVGGLLWTYKAGTSEFALTYQDQAGTTPWPNPIILNSRGETGGELWLSPDNEYRLVVETAPEYGQTHGVVITEFDNVSGVNAPATEASDNWVLFPESPNYVSNTSFTVAGNYRSIFVANRKLQITDTGGVSIHSVISSSFATGFTTVNITGLTDSGISSVKYSEIMPSASPDRFTDLTITNDMTVSDDAVIDGDLIVGGTASGGGMWTDANSPATKATNGYQEFKSGVIIQWGKATSNSVTGIASITLPKVFTNAAYSITTTCIETASTIDKVTATVRSGQTVSAFSLYLQDQTGTAAGSYDIYWMAIGY